MAKRRIVNYKAEIVAALFTKAETHRQYRRALRLAQELDKHAQLTVFPALFSAADRLHVDRATGVPKVQPRGFVDVRGRAVAVEILS